MVGQASGGRKHRRRDFHIVLGLLLLSLITINLPFEAQREIGNALRESVLRPFIEVQLMVARTRARARDYLTVRAQLDSALTFVASAATLAEENRQIRDLLDLHERSPSRLVAASVIRSGTSGSSSVFRLDAGAGDGIRSFDAVVTAQGLLGQVQEVGPGSSMGYDWSHPDFRVSAMIVTNEGQAHGLVEAERGQFREQDRLVLRGTAFLSDLEPGARVLTSGRGGVFPRGILIGWVGEVAGASAGWDISYYIDPAVYPGAATYASVHVVMPADTLQAVANTADSVAVADAFR
ncbi:MAG: rod shape-determining protein MreC [Gemmatimonadetes bacterium]|nr:rod shape-determining protein MreC [Gemmatimonadota bacterium]MXX36221.1 rod shape-determining protein MreC [Gemmatimonadota bacterium]MYD12763.1 rod shape-determining protein MreC [Gemmatimonadota bacterium]MYI66019.1 rod shape-determining protein MreC [Gemmatimonadota bacterium]